MLKFLRRIERLSYPSEYRALQGARSMRDLVDYCEAESVDDLIIVTGEEFYFLAVKSTREIVDIAGKMTVSDISRIRSVIRSNFSGKCVTLDARETTSYRVVKLIGSIVSDTRYIWGDEYFHELTILVK